MAENNFLRKPPVDDGDDRLFRDKLTPDTLFLQYVKADKNDILCWLDEESALRELAYLKEQKKQIEKSYTELVEYINTLYSPSLDAVNLSIATINTKIQNFVREHAEDIPLEKIDGVERGEKILGDYKVEITKTVKVKKVPQTKPQANADRDPDNEEIFSESSVEEADKELYVKNTDCDCPFY